ncbi:MAG: hypothetical protein NNA20_00605 [Nitrospira sp.]|nr:hypothetical protein [Nitrospira sp.]
MVDVGDSAFDLAAGGMDLQGVAPVNRRPVVTAIVTKTEKVSVDGCAHFL